MSSRSISLLRYSRIFYANHQLGIHHFLHKKSTPQQQSKFGFYTAFNRYLHHDRVYRQQEQIPVKEIPNVNTFVEYENLFAFDVFKEKKEYNHYQNDAMVYEDSFLGYEPYYMASSPEAVKSLLQDIDHFNISQILALLRSLILHMPFKTDPRAYDSLPKDSNFRLITEKLDKCCLQMLNTMSPNFAKSEDFLPFIEMANLWYELGMDRHSEFKEVLTKKLCDFQGPLCNYSFLQLMFLINLHSRPGFPSRFFPHELKLAIIEKTEAYLRNESSISVKDLTLVAIGFANTRTSMPENVFVPFIDKCLTGFSDIETPLENFITSIVSIFRVIRYTFNNFEVDLRKFKPNVKQLIDVIVQHPEQYINSAIVASQLILTMNTVKLQEQKTVYSLVFEKMIEDLENMSIKDIDRVLYSMADAMLMCKHSKLKTIEDFVCNSPDTKLYLDSVFSLYSSFRVMGYDPRNLLKMIQDQELIQYTLDTGKDKCYKWLILDDTIIRLLRDDHSPVSRLLTDEQVTNNRAKVFVKTTKTATSKHTRFLRSIRDVLQPKYGSALKFIYLFPFSPYPFPVILDEKAQKIIEKCQSEGTMTKRIEPPSIDGDDVISYNPKFSTPNLFEGSTAIRILLTLHYTSEGKIRGYANMNIKLLEALGLKVLHLHQREYYVFLLSRHMMNPHSADYAECSQRLLSFVESNH